MNTLLINTSLGHTIVTLVAFVILLLIVKHFAWGPLTKILSERKQVIDHDIQTAASEKAAAQDANRDAQLALRDARAEATQIILQAKKQGSQRRGYPHEGDRSEGYCLGTSPYVK